MSRWVFKIIKWGLIAVVVYFVSAVAYLIVFFEGPGTDTPFDEAHEKALQSFVDGVGFGVVRMRSLEHWNEISVKIGRESYQVDSIKLIGATKEDGPRYFTEYRGASKKRISEEIYRTLTPEELKALELLRSGEQSFYMEAVEDTSRILDEDTRVIAPLFARESCLRCYEAEVGELLGAFDYRLTKVED